MGKAKKAEKPKLTCHDCIHENACIMQNGGNPMSDENDATQCFNFEELRNSAAYLLGKLESVRHGCWQSFGEGRLYDVIRCSECHTEPKSIAVIGGGNVIDRIYDLDKWCPNCGAVMDKKEDSEK